MSPIKRMIAEIHERSIWQILLVYLGAGWLTLQIVDQLVQQYLLPAWVYRGAFALILAGLPIVVATAVVERGVSFWKSQRETTAAESDRVVALRRRFFTWRNAILGGVGAFALLALLAAGYLASRAFGVGPGATLIAQGVLEEREPIILADFENRTQDSLLATAITEALRIDLAQSPAVMLVDPDRIREAMGRAEMAPTAKLGRESAREIAAREGVKAVLAGGVTPVGSSYVITASLIAAESGEELVGDRQTAEDADQVIDALDRLSSRLRAGIGESLGSVRASPPLPRVTTASLEALELYAVSLEHQRRGDMDAAIGVLERAVAIDTAFASAYRGLAIHHGNQGDPAAAQAAIDRAYRHAERLPVGERYKMAAAFHSYRAVFDSAAVYYRLLIDLGAEDFVVVNNLGDLNERMGRHEEALRLYRRAVAMNPTIAGHINVASSARSLGELALADTAVAAIREINPESWRVRQQWGANRYFARDWDVLGDSAASWRRQEGPIRFDGAFWLAVLAGADGHVDRAVSLADSAFDVSVELGAPFFGYWTLVPMASAALAGGRPGTVVPYLERHRSASLLEGAPMFRHIALSWVGIGYAMAGDLESAEAAIARADSLAASTDFHPLGGAAAARAYVALQEERPEEALAQVERAIAADFGLTRHFTRYARAEALSALDRLPEAAAQFDSLTSMKGLNFTDVGTYGALLPLAHERAAQTYLAVADTAAALRHLAAFVELWSDADPALQARVEVAQATLEAILAVRG